MEKSSKTKKQQTAVEKNTKTKKHQKTSVFKGVCFKKGRWWAQYQKVKFHGLYSTEMEAVAHFLVVYCGCGLNSVKKRDFMRMDNALEKGRKSIDEYQQVDDDNLVHHFSIDKNHIVKVDKDAYIKYRDYPWFMRLGQVIGISGFKMVDGKCLFEYIALSELIYKDKYGNENGESFSLIKINGDDLDLRCGNLRKSAPECVPMNDTGIFKQFDLR